MRHIVAVAAILLVFTPSLGASDLESAIEKLDRELLVWTRSDDSARRAFAVRVLAATMSPNWEAARDAVAASLDPEDRLALADAAMTKNDTSEVIVSLATQLFASPHPYEHEIGRDLLSTLDLLPTRKQWLRALPTNDRLAVDYYRELITDLEIDPGLTRRDVGQLVKRCERNCTALERPHQKRLASKVSLDSAADIVRHVAGLGPGANLSEAYVAMSQLSAGELESLILGWPDNHARPQKTAPLLEMAALSGVAYSESIDHRLGGWPKAALQRTIAGLLWSNERVLLGGAREAGNDILALSEILTPYGYALARVSDSAGREVFDLVLNALDGETVPSPDGRRVEGAFATGKAFDEIFDQWVESDRRDRDQLISLLSSPDQRAITLRDLLRQHGSFEWDLSHAILYGDGPESPYRSNHPTPSHGGLQSCLARLLALGHLPWTPLVQELESELDERSIEILANTNPSEFVSALLARAARSEITPRNRDLDTLAASLFGRWPGPPGWERLLPSTSANRTALPLTGTQIEKLGTRLRRVGERNATGLIRAVSQANAAVVDRVYSHRPAGAVWWPIEPRGIAAPSERRPLLDALESEDFIVRHGAAHLLWERFRDDEGLRHLLEESLASDVEVAESALLHLATMRSVDAIPTFVEALDNDHPPIRAAALGGLRLLRFVQAAPHAELLLTDPDQAVARQACAYVGAMARPDTWRLLLPLYGATCAGYDFDGTDPLKIIDLLETISSSRALTSHERRWLVDVTGEGGGSARLLPDRHLIIEARTSLEDTAPPGRNFVSLKVRVERYLAEPNRKLEIRGDLAHVTGTWRIDRDRLEAWWLSENVRPIREVYRREAKRDLLNGTTKLANEVIAYSELRSAALRDLFRRWDLRDSVELHSLLIYWLGRDEGNFMALTPARWQEAISRWDAALRGAR